MAAATFFDLRNHHDKGFAADTPKALYESYTADLFRFDQLYRQFCEAADTAESQGWDILKDMRAKIEDVYGNWYIAGLARHWGEQLEGGGLLSDWQIDGIRPQYEFFKRYVQPRLDEAEDRRAFVIISDAFRFEAAQELTAELNGRYRFTAALKSQLGVLPSYTALGMASLLPHHELAYKDDGSVRVSCTEAPCLRRS